MNGPIAQLVALICHANGILQGRHSRSFFPANSTCQFCDSVTFVRLKRRWFNKPPIELPVASNPDAWFKHLESSGCRAARIHHSVQNRPGISDRMSAGFVGGGGRWILEAKRSKTSDYYEAQWTVWNQNAPEKRIWRVVYGMFAENSPSQTVADTNLLALKTELRPILHAIYQFAIEHDLGLFAEKFQKARECLDSDRPSELVYHTDLAPQGLLNAESAQLLAAAQAAWVFGGMGSWNDLGFEGPDQTRYEKLSQQLFQMLNFVICIATNSSALKRD